MTADDEDVFEELLKRGREKKQQGAPPHTSENMTGANSSNMRSYTHCLSAQKSSSEELAVAKEKRAKAADDRARKRKERLAQKWQDNGE